MSNDVNNSLRALEMLLYMFRFERRVYLLVTVVALIILLASAIWLMFSGSIALALGMFGSSGLITITTSRLLTMWNQAFGLIQSALQSKGKYDA